MSVTLVNPIEARQFMHGMGRRAKTDAIDARMLAEFGRVRQPTATPLQPMEERQLSELLTYRRQLIQDRISLTNQQSHFLQPLVKRSAAAQLKVIVSEIEKLEQAMLNLVASSPRLQALYALICSIPGVGPISALTIIGQLPEFGILSRQQIAALVGVAPCNRDSGAKKGHRAISGGRYQVRTVLYMASLVATTHNKSPKEFKDRLIEKGKPTKIAMIACVRKIITIINAIVRDRKPWEAKPA